MDIHFLITLIFILLFVGAICFLINKIPGIPAPIPTVINIIIALVVLLWLFDSVVGIGSSTGHHLIGCS